MKAGIGVRVPGRQSEAKISSDLDPSRNRPTLPPKTYRLRAVFKNKKVRQFLGGLFVCGKLKRDPRAPAERGVSKSADGLLQGGVRPRLAQTG